MIAQPESRHLEPPSPHLQLTYQSFVCQLLRGYDNVKCHPLYTTEVIPLHNDLRYAHL